WRLEQSGCDNKTLFVWLYGVPQRYSSISGPPGEIVKLTNFDGISDNGCGTFPIIVSSQLKSNDLWEQWWGVEYPRASARHIGAFQFAVRTSRISYSKPSNDKQSICEESNRSIGRLHLTQEFPPPAFLLGMRTCIRNYGQRIQTQCEAEN